MTGVDVYDYGTI